MRVRKQKQTININGREFDLKGVISNEAINNLEFKSLERCYARPSQAKISIYYSWYNIISNDSNIICYGVGSYNCNIFTINSIVDINDKRYYLHITPTKNECYDII